MHTDKVLIRKLEVVPPNPFSVIPVYLCQENKPVVNFTADVMRSKFQSFSKKTIDALYLTETIRT